MARRVTDPDELAQVQLGMFRFTKQALSEWFDGQTWVLKAGDDYPANMSFQSLRTRLRSAAYSRGGSIQIWRSAMDEVRIQFTKKEKA